MQGSETGPDEGGACVGEAGLKENIPPPTPTPRAQFPAIFGEKVMYKFWAPPIFKKQ